MVLHKPWSPPLVSAVFPRSPEWLAAVLAQDGFGFEILSLLLQKDTSRAYLFTFLKNSLPFCTLSSL